MREYLLSIIGVCVLGVIVSMILPSGQMSKYIKAFFGLFTILVIISPIPKLLNSNYDFSSLFYNQKSTEIDADFIDATNKKIVNQLKLLIQKNCEKSGYFGVECEIESNLENNNLIIKKIYLNLENLVISQNVVHINKYTEIVQAVQQVVNVEKEQIVFNE